MNSNVQKVFCLVAIFVIATFSIQYDSFGQKKGNKKRKSNKPLTEEEILQSEFYFIEAEKFFLREEYAKSLDMFNRSLEINDKNAAAYYKIAEIHVQDEKYRDAVPFALKAKELDPSNKYFYILNAKLNLQLGNYKSAAADYEELFKRFKGNEDYLFDLASIYEYTDESKEAIGVYDRIENIYGKYLEITKQKVRIYEELKDIDAARGEWMNLLEFSPSVKHYIGFIGFLEKNGNEKDVTQVFDEAIAENPESNELLLKAAQIAFSNDESKKGLELLQKPFADRTVPADQKINSLIAIIPKLTDGELSESVLNLTKMLGDAHDKDFKTLAFTGDVYFQLQKTEEALDYYLKAVELESNKFDVWQNIIVIETQLNKYDDVIAHCEQAKEVYPNQALLYFYAGAAHLMKKDFKKSIYEMEKGTRYARRDKNLLNALYGQLGDAYNGIGDFEKSDDAFEKALGLGVDDTYVLNNYSYYLSLRGEKLEKAVEMSTKLVDENPKNPSYLDTHGWTLYKSGKYKE